MVLVKILPVVLGNKKGINFTRMLYDLTISVLKIVVNLMRSLF